MGLKGCDFVYKQRILKHLENLEWIHAEKLEKEINPKFKKLFYLDLDELGANEYLIANGKGEVSLHFFCSIRLYRKQLASKIFVATLEVIAVVIALLALLVDAFPAFRELLQLMVK